MIREFESMLAFTEHFVKIGLSMEVAQHRALGEVLKLLEHDMKAQVGIYQDSIGPYPEWAPLAESTEAEKARLGYPANAPLLREELLEESFRHDQEGNEGTVGSIDPIMEFHEFGTVKMPPRPIIGPALERNRERIQSLLGKAMVRAIMGARLVDDPYLGPDIEG